jgi:hypothetical protein
MKSRLVASVSVVLLVGGLFGAEVLKSGPQNGEKVPGPFEPLNVTGEMAGKKCCQYCKNGDNPVAVVFARRITPEVTLLLKKLDGCTAKNKAAKMGSYAVFCSDADGLEKQLKEVAEKEKIKYLVLTIDNPSGPKKYNIAKDADVTVLLYTDHVVKANHTFKKGELKEKDIEKIVGDVAKILPEK